MITKKIILFSSLVLFFSQSFGANHPVTLEKNQAQLVKIDQPVKEIFVTNPEIADVQMNTPPNLYIFGRKPGPTEVIVTLQDGNVKKYAVTCTHQLSGLRTSLRELYPNETIEVRSLPLGISLTGIVSSAVVSKDIEAIVAQYVEGNEKVINNLNVGGSSQVMLKVKIAEVQRTVMNAFNLSMGSAFKHAPKNFTWGLLTGYSPTQPYGGATLTDPTGFARTGNGSIGASLNNSDFTASALLDLIDQEGLGTVLAEPNLIALSGETASFLVGGEYPFPTPQSDGSITIEFKKFGISLSFAPTVLASNLINLRVIPEVSEIDNTNKVDILSTNGTKSSVASIKTRRAETSVELASGQSLAIAGLIKSNTTNNLNEYPGLADLPILGALFRSTNFQTNQTELVIIITPYLVEPTTPDSFATPLDQVNPARPLEMLIERRLNHKKPEVDDEQSSEDPTAHLYGDSGFYIE